MLRLLHCYVLCALVLSAQEPSSFGGLRFRELPKPIPCLAGINDLGEIAGGCDQPFRISSEGVQTPLPVVGLPVAINNLGQIVLNHDNQVILLHPDGRAERRTVEGAERVRAHGVNNTGEIAGEADFKPVLWSADGIPRILPVRYSPIGRNGYALDINDSGTIIGADNGNTYLNLFRRTATGLERSGHLGLIWGGDIANDGTMLITSSRAITGSRSWVVDADFNTLYSFGSRTPSTMSPSGRLIAGPGYIAERCATEVDPLRADVPASGGKLRVRVSAESGCEWSYPDGAGSGNAEIELNIAAAQGSHHLFIAGKDVKVRQGDSGCEVLLPGHRLLVPAQGGTYVVPIRAEEGCEWPAQPDSPWVTVDRPQGGTGSGEVVVTVEPNPFVRIRPASVLLGYTRLAIDQQAAACVYEVTPPRRLPAGAGAVTVSVRADNACPWTMSSPAVWLLEGQRRAFIEGRVVSTLTFAANPGKAERTAVLTIAGQQFTVTQDPARIGEPYSVEPFDSAGMKQTFRFRILEPLGTDYPGAAFLRIGTACTIEYRHGSLRPFDVSGTCTLEDASSVLADGFRVLSVTLALKERGLLSLSSDFRQLGVFLSTPTPPTAIPVTRPVDVPANPPAGSSLWIDSRSGAGGTFRLRVDPALGTPQSLVVSFDRCVITIDPAARTLRLDNAAVGFGTARTLETQYCMVDPARSRLALPIVDLTVFFPALDPMSFKRIVLSVLPASGAPVVTDLGTYLAMMSDTLPLLSLHDGLVKIAFRSEVPISQAQVVFGRDENSECRVVFDRESGQLSSGPRPEIALIGNAIVMLFTRPVCPGQPEDSGIYTSYTPAGFSNTGWRRLR